MEFNAQQAPAVLKLIEQTLQESDPAPDKIKKIWMIMLVLRARNLASAIQNITGPVVAGGPFKGLKVTHDALLGYNGCLLLGSYEHELHATVEKIIAGNYTRILNIGCSVGYYAVGLALRMPHIVIDAFDTDPEARRKCAEMAALNGVQDRVRISGAFKGEDFAAYAKEKTLALVDIEGAEEMLLDPALYPALKKIDVVAELHHVVDQDLPKLIVERFAASHKVELIFNRFALPDLSAVIPASGYVDPFDHMLLGWEGRAGPTPWGIFTSKNNGL